MSIVNSCESWIFYSWKVFIDTFNYPASCPSQFITFSQSGELSINSNKKMNHSIVLLEILVTTLSLKQFVEKTVNLFPISFLIPVFLNETYSTHFETEYKFMLDIFEVRCHFLKVRQSLWWFLFFSS